MPHVELSDGKRFEASDGVSILEAARTAGLVLEHSCRTGRCGLCRARVLGGETRALRREESLSDAERADGVVLTCARAATSDVSLDVTDLGMPADIVRKLLPCRIASLESVADDVLVVRLKLPPNAGFRYLPGQYVDVIAGGLRRSYSIANAPAEDGQLELHVRRVDGGAMSDFWFDRAKLGDLLRFEGPLGTFFIRDRPGPVIFLATGTGFAPIKAMIESFAAHPERPSATLFWGGRTAADHYHPVATAATLDFVPVLSRAVAEGVTTGYVQDVLLARGPDLANATVYACGSSAMIDSARQKLHAAGLPLGAFFADSFLCSSTPPEGED